MSIDIETPRLRLRALTVEDVSERYLCWFRDADAARHISSAAATHSLSDLREYVRMRQGRDDVLFLGIFQKQDGTHIGNVKYEPINRADKYAVMGILIGDSANRGKGIAAEALRAAGGWLKVNYGLTHIVLTVKPEHAQAIRAYQSAGFAIQSPPSFRAIDGVMTMVQWL